MKRGLIIGIIFVNFILVSGVVIAYNDQVSLQYSTGEFVIDYYLNLTFLDFGSASVLVNGEGRSLDSTYENSPYTISRVGGLDLILKNIDSRTYIGGNQDAIIWVGVEFNISEGETRNLVIDGETYEIVINFIDSDKVQFRVNGENSEKKSEQENPPYIISSSLQGIDFIVKDILYQKFVGGDRQTTVVFGKDINFSLIDPCFSDCNILDEKICDGNGFKICGEYDEDVCRDWSLVTNCDSGETCKNGICVDNNVPVTCVDECDIDDKECSNSTNYKICSSYDEDSCLEWSNPILCPMGPIGRMCSGDGECAGFPDPDPDPTPEPTRECEPIGLREDENYCSPNYEWVIQKLERNSCENDFECKGNDCSDGTCGEMSVAAEDDKGWIIWLIVGGIVLIIFLVIFLVIRR